MLIFQCRIKGSNIFIDLHYAVEKQ